MMEQFPRPTPRAAPRLKKGGIPDGRYERTRLQHGRLIEAFLRLVATEKRMPSAQDVADLADCSVRTVFVHFAEMGALTCAAFDSAVLTTLPGLSDGSDDRIRSFVTAYSATAEKWHGLWSLLRADPSAEAERTVDRMHEAVRTSLQQAFGPELSRRSPAELASALVLLESVLDFAVWRRMRERDGMSVKRARAAWGEMIAAILARVPSLSA